MIIVSASFQTLLKIFNSLCIACSAEIYETFIAFRGKYLSSKSDEAFHC